MCALIHWTVAIPINRNVGGHDGWVGVWMGG